MNLKLILPHPQMEAQFNEYVAEWKKSGEEMVPSSADPGGSDYATWLDEARAIQDIETCPPHLVPADTYFLIDENEKIVGAINIRRELNDYLYKFGGNIGYGIRPSERKKGYATIMLKLGLEKCQELGMKKILITCDKNNIASAKTIVANGGILEDEVPEGDGITQRYWINL